MATGVLNGHISLAQLAEAFAVADYVPSMEGLPEGLQKEEFAATYGHPLDERFQRMREVIEKRILALPVYGDGLAGPVERP